MPGHNIIGPQLKRLRRLKGLDQDQFAARCCRRGLMISENTVSKIEVGFRRVIDREIVVFALVLGCQPGDLFHERERR